MNMKHKQCYSSGRKAAVRTLGSVGAALLLCSYSLFAFADDDVDADDKWYVGRALTEVPATESKDESIENTSVSVSNVGADDNRNGWKVNVEYDLSEHFAIGAGYVDLKDTEVDINGTEQTGFTPGRQFLPNSADGFTVESIYHYNLSDNIGLTGSVGLFNWEGDFTSQAINNPNNLDKQSGNQSGTDLYFGLGGGYQLTEDMTLEVNWERYKLDDEATQMWSIGVNYHFK